MQPFTSIVVVAPTGDELSYLSLVHTVLGETLQDMPLTTNTGAPLKLRRFLRHQTMEKSVLLDEDKSTKGTKRATVKP